jgi:6-hydroxycyclohex-1-ene-1-carbonyl-CoA dehydrogenase
MKGIQLIAAGAPLELRDLPDPHPAESEVVVRVAGCGVCHTDIGFWRDGVPTKKALPLTLGHEVAGTVVEAGADARHLVGRDVIVPAVIPCGVCDLCTEGRANICRRQLMPGNDVDGGFAEYLVVPARGLCPVQQRGRYQLAELAVVADAVTTPYQAVMRSGLRAGDLALVVGVGGVGTYCAQIAAAAGAHVVAIDVDDDRLAAIAPHGPGLTLNSATFDFKELRQRVRRQAQTWSCPEHSWKIFECSGHPGGQEAAFGLLTYASTLMVIGFTLGKVELRLSNAMAFDATIQGTWGCKPELYPPALALVTSGKITLAPFIETFPMSTGPDVVRRVAEHAITRRAILVPDWQ